MGQLTKLTGKLMEPIQRGTKTFDMNNVKAHINTIHTDFVHDSSQQVYDFFRDVFHEYSIWNRSISFIPIVYLSCLVIAYSITGIPSYYDPVNRVQNTFNVAYELAMPYFLILVSIIVIYRFAKSFWAMISRIPPDARSLFSAMGSIAGLVIGFVVGQLASEESDEDATILQTVWSYTGGALSLSVASAINRLIYALIGYAFGGAWLSIIGVLLFLSCIWLSFSLVNLVLTAASYMYSLLQSGRGNEAMVPSPSSFIDLIDIRRGRKKRVNAPAVCEVHTPELITVQAGAQPKENIAGKIQWLVERNVLIQQNIDDLDRSNQNYFAQIPARILAMLLRVITAGNVNLVSLLDCPLMVRTKTLYSISGMGMTDSIYKHIMENALQDNKIVFDENRAKASRALHTGPWCQQAAYSKWLDKKYEGDQMYDRMITRTALMQAYNELVTPPRLRELGRVSDENNRPGGGLLLREEFVTTLEEYNDAFKLMVSDSRQSIGMKEREWFTYTKMNYDAMDLLGMKTSHLREQEEGGALGLVTGADIQEALGTNDPVRRAVILGNVYAVQDIECGEKVNMSHPCCSGLPVLPQYGSKDQYVLQAWGENHHYKFSRNFY